MPRYKDEYIVAMTEEEKSFISATSIAFGINKTLCSSVESARERIRNKMKELSFPIWTLLSILGAQDLETDSKDISDLINLYLALPIMLLRNQDKLIMILPPLSERNVLSVRMQQQICLGYLPRSSVLRVWRLI